MYERHTYKLVAIRVISVILVGTFWVTNVAFASQESFICTLAAQTPLNPMVEIVKNGDVLTIVEDSNTFKKIKEGFQVDWENIYIEKLRKQAKGMGVGSDSLKELVKEHFKECNFSETTKRKIKSEKRKFVIPPYETCQKEGTFGYGDVYKCAKSMAKQGGYDFSEEISKGVIKHPAEYVDRELTNTEKSIAKIFEEELKGYFGRPWRGEDAPPESHLLLLDYSFFLTLLVHDHFIDGTDPFHATNMKKIALGVDFLKETFSQKKVYKNHKAALMDLCADVLRGNRYEGTRELKEGSLKIVSDQRSEMADMLINIGSEGIFDFFIDNVGPELSAELRLMDYLLDNNIVGHVRVHVKYAPFSISDVWGTEEDVMKPYLGPTLDSIEKSGVKEMEKLASRLREKIKYKKITFKREKFTTYRADLRKAANEVNKSLSGSGGAIFVGDNLYRRLFGNRKWPRTASISDILDYIDIPVGLIRMVKSDMEIEIPAETSIDANAGVIQVKRASKLTKIWNKTVVVFPDVRDSWVGMGKELYDNNASVRKIYDTAYAVLGYDDISRLFLKEEDIGNLEILCVSMILYDIAIFELFKEKRQYDFKPLACMGSSSGNITSAIASGSVSLKDGLRIIQKQARMLGKAFKEFKHGVITVYGLEMSQVKSFLDPGNVEIVEDFSPHYISLMISDNTKVEELRNKFLRLGAKKVNYTEEREIKAAAHISYYGKHKEKLQKEIESMEIKNPSIPIISTATGQLLTTQQEVREFVKSQLFEPIFWRSAVKTAVEHGADMIFPIGTWDKLKKKVKGGETNFSILEVAGQDDIDDLTDSQIADQYKVQKESKWGEKFIHHMLWRAATAKKRFNEGKIKSPTIIIGYDRNLVPEIQQSYIQGIFNELSRLSREKGLDNIVVKRGKGVALAHAIKKEAKKRRNVPNSNIIILGDHKTLDKKAFDFFRKGIDPDEWAFFAKVEMPKGTDNQYVRLLEMLTISVNLAFGKFVSLDNPHMRIIQEGKRTFRFLPDIEPYEHELLKEIYEKQLESMKFA